MPDTIPQWLMMGPLHDMMQAVRMAKESRRANDLLKEHKDALLACKSVLNPQRVPLALIGVQMRPNRPLALALWPVLGIVCLIAERAHAERYTCTWHQYERGECLPILKDAGPMPQSLQRLMAEGSG
jgi:hypothetical protein